MKEHEIASAVRGKAGLADDQHATAATRATLSVLGQRLTGNDLPPAITEVLPAAQHSDTFGVEEFYRRVAQVEDRGCTPDGAREHARAVVAALRSGVSEGEFDDLTAQLPNDYRQDLLSTAGIEDQK